MKLGALVLFVLTSITAFAQTVALPHAPAQYALADAVPTADRLDLSSESSSAYLTSYPLPFAADPASLVTVSMVRPVPTREQEPFLRSRINRMLAGADLGVRLTDAASTLRNGNSPCKCFEEAGHFLGFSLKPVAAHPPAQIAYSAGIATTYTLVSRMIWRASYQHPSHGKLLRFASRMVPLTDIAWDGAISTHNLAEYRTTAP